ncbi:MAG: cell division protein FtsL [Deltaproteobacteria bacterium]|nr:cell division protein FtsL [Deltaproteobacteria bacterium]MBW2071624.1 cell division protein FtsL [Deltaproteobacteria bacterium]
MKRGTTKGKFLRRQQLRSQMGLILLLLLWALASGFGYVWCRMKVVDLGYRLAAAHRTHSRLVDDNKKLSLELARLRSPERVEQVALSRLGLSRPNKNQIVVLP